jgi:hypothetical protein
MQAVVYDQALEFEVREIAEPEAGPGEVKIKVTQAGFCGTDLHLHHGGFGAKFPLVPGRHRLRGRPAGRRQPQRLLRPLRLLPRGRPRALREPARRRREP